LREGGVIEQQIRFTQASDGVRIAYAVAGHGPPLVKAAHWLSHLEFEWRSPLWRSWLQSLAERWTLIRYDERGCGLSDRHVESFSFDDWLRDLEAVVDACGLERFTLVGMSQGGPIAIAYAHKYPERVSHLVLYGTYLRGRPKWFGSAEPEKESETLIRLIELGWGRAGSPYAEVFASLFLTQPDPQQRRQFTEIQRLSASPATAAAIVRVFDAIDVTAMARALSVPTLVLHARDDARVPFEEGRHAASVIPGARLVPLDGASHILQPGEPALDQFLGAVAEFLKYPADSVARSPDGIAALTRREREVLELIARGYDNGIIAERLFLSPSTVRNHITRIFAKLGVRNRAETIVRARRSGFGHGSGSSNRELGP
jgi:pimeloyl-ACP methyl ester carboxylesterase/DNA-binding CsgD family transcriptional regulator